MSNIFMRFMSCFVLIILTALLSGCYIKQRQMDYLYSREIPTLHVPPGISCVNVGSDCIIPPVMGDVPRQPVCIVPPGR